MISGYAAISNVSALCADEIAHSNKMLVVLEMELKHLP